MIKWLIIGFLKIKKRINDAFWWRANLFILKCLKCEVGNNFVAVGRLNLYIGNQSRVLLGNNITIKSGINNNPLSRNIETTICVEDGALLSIGSNCGISSSCIWAHTAIEIGDHVMIGANTTIMDSDAHSLDSIYRIDCELDKKNKVSKPIIIESYVLIGTGVIILKGVRIGEGSVVGSGSVVTKDIPSRVVAAGNPARVIRTI
jgi:acetyltransferase-like isoleucine patch superfamily enzyme